MATDKIPEGCKLVALHTGDGWYLAVQDRNLNEIAILDWPFGEKEIKTSRELEACGFEII